MKMRVNCGLHGNASHWEYDLSRVHAGISCERVEVFPVTFKPSECEIPNRSAGHALNTGVALLNSH